MMISEIIKNSIGNTAIKKISGEVVTIEAALVKDSILNVTIKKENGELETLDFMVFIMNYCDFKRVKEEAVEEPTREISLDLYNEVAALVPDYDEMQVTELIEDVSIAAQQCVDFSEFISYSIKLAESVAAIIEKHNYKFDC
jgi:hypothetical protein